MQRQQQSASYGSRYGGKNYLRNNVTADNPNRSSHKPVQRLVTGSLQKSNFSGGFWDQTSSSNSSTRRILELQKA